MVKLYCDLTDDERDLFFKWKESNAKPTGCEDNEHSVGRIVEAVKALGFEECESDEDDACEKCGKPCQPLYFGNADYWDCREGDYWCGQCVLKFHEANQQDYAEAMLNNNLTGQADKDGSVEGVVE
jgi:hypothetical protein